MTELSLFPLWRHQHHNNIWGQFRLCVTAVHGRSTLYHTHPYYYVWMIILPVVYLSRIIFLYTPPKRVSTTTILTPTACAMAHDVHSELPPLQAISRYCVSLPTGAQHPITQKCKIVSLFCIAFFPHCHTSDSIVYMWFYWAPTAPPTGVSPAMCLRSVAVAGPRAGWPLPDGANNDRRGGLIGW